MTIPKCENGIKFLRLKAFKNIFHFTLPNSGSSWCYTELVPPVMSPVNMASAVCRRFLLQRSTHGFLLSSRAKPIFFRYVSIPLFFIFHVNIFDNTSDYFDIAPKRLTLDTTNLSFHFCSVVCLKIKFSGTNNRIIYITYIKAWSCPRVLPVKWFVLTTVA